jgi:hypothetical protein
MQVGITIAWEAMRRIGCTSRLPAFRAIERDEAVIAQWRRYQVPAAKDCSAANRLDLFRRGVRPDAETA